MKRKIIISAMIAVAVASSTTALLALHKSGAEPTVIEEDGVRSGAIAVRVHPLPKKLDFAGETIPLERNYAREAIEREVLTTSSMHTSTMLTLRRTARYFPIIEPILEEYGVPNDFKYLALAESGLNENAYSPAHAAGMWQFIKSAAADYGLETGEDVDMRYHIEESTRAACRYLLRSYSTFGNWTLAAASYNLGATGVKRRMETQEVKNYWDLFLPEETMRYVPRIVSFKILMESPEDYGFYLGKKDYFHPYKDYVEVTTNERNIDWSKFAAKYDTNYRILRILNPWIRSYSYANPRGKTYTVKVPTKKFKA